MKKYTLQRVSSTERGVFGVLIDPEGTPVCCTLERPWLDNQRNVSCIPNGEYGVVKHNGAKYKNVWRLKNVPGRSGILFHAGNTMKDSRGCILVGQKFWKDGVLKSRVALDTLRDILPDNFELTVTGVL